MVRIALAGILGGMAFFAGGAISHMVFDWQDRHRRDFPSVPAIQEFVGKERLAPGIHFFPQPPAGFRSMDAKTQAAAYAKLEADYLAGPTGMLIVNDPGEELMPASTFAIEILSNIGMALTAAGVLAYARPGLGFAARFLVVEALGLFAWLSISVSNRVWYHFPLPWILDEFCCCAFEAALAGLVIAALVVPKPADPASKPAS